MKIKITAIILFLFFGPNTGEAQNRVSRTNALSIEAGKNGLIYNLNYDHRFKNKNLGVRFGIGSNFAKYLPAFTIGGGSYYLVGKGMNLLELGLDLNYLSIHEVSDDQRGVTLLYPGYTINTCYASANVGYRHYGNKTLFRVGVSPGIANSEFIPGAYVSFGVRF